MEPLRGTTILELLREKPGRYILYNLWRYRMKEADGADVIMNGQPVEPYAVHMDDLIEAGNLVRDCAVYRLAPDAG